MVKKYCFYLLLPGRYNCKMFGIEYDGCDWCVPNKWYKNKFIWKIKTFLEWARRQNWIL